MYSSVKQSSMRKKNNQISLYIPIILVGLYSMSTIVLYFLGPWDWPTKNLFIFSTLLLAYNVALILGYFLGIKVNIGNKFKDSLQIDNYGPSRKGLKYINICIYIFFVFTVLNCIRVTGLSSFAPFDYISEVIKGIKDPALQYRENLGRAHGSAFGGSLLSYLNVLISPFIWGAIPLALFYFKKLPLFTKFIAIFCIFLECSRWIAIGTNKGIFDIAITIVTVLLIKNILRNRNKETRLRRKNIKAKVLFFLILPMYFFTTAISDRLGGNVTKYNMVINNVPINPDSFLMKITPEFFETALILISSYVTQGYYALSMAIALPYTPLYGIGNSMFLMENYKKFSNIDVFEYTYQAKLAEYGWDPFVNWHTIYTWLANDVSFIGVIFVMLVLGFIYAKVWKDVLYSENSIAIVLMCLFSLIFIFMSSNNVILSNPTSFMAFWGLLMYWIFLKLFSPIRRKQN